MLYLSSPASVLYHLRVQMFITLMLTASLIPVLCIDCAKSNISITRRLGLVIYLWAWLTNMFGRHTLLTGGYISVCNKHVSRWLILKPVLLNLLFIQLARVDYYLDFLFSCSFARRLSHSHYSRLRIGRRRWQDWKMRLRSDMEGGLDPQTFSSHRLP